MRKPDWHKILSSYLREKKDAPFVWGDNDCVLFAAKFFEQVTGIDFYSEYGAYGSEEEARKIMTENGGLQQMVTRALGEPHDNFMKAKRADVVLMKIPDETLGIVDDSGQRVACASRKGLVLLPLKRASLIWSY